MPTYDYECKDCEYSFEQFQSMSDDTLTLCPKCGKEELRRLIGGGLGIIFKGSGFYVNDAKPKSSPSGSAKKTDESKASPSATNSSSSSSSSGESTGSSPAKAASGS